jgi:hypothetical protein
MELKAIRELAVNRKIHEIMIMPCSGDHYIVCIDLKENYDDVMKRKSLFITTARKPTAKRYKTLDAAYRDILSIGLNYCTIAFFVDTKFKPAFYDYCPECDSHSIYEKDSGEVGCSDCGLVIVKGVV